MGEEPKLQYEVMMILGKAPSNVDPQDSTGAGYRPGTPNTYRVRLIEATGEGPREQHRTVADLGIHATPDHARDAVATHKKENPKFADLQITYVS